MKLLKEGMSSIQFRDANLAKTILIFRNSCSVRNIQSGSLGLMPHWMMLGFIGIIAM